MSGQPYSEVLTWEPEEVATVVQWLDDQNDAAEDARRKGSG